ncbi:cytochrome c oxidase accessory protein CcoG [Gynuella sp.]|uniref:cytochrome c oxidase accessory protein CcoG n=1 Tax=Gynuella sp. TaxID=2969146 RepID=UPI003D0F98D2
MSEKIEVQDVTPKSESYDLYQAHEKIYIRRVKGLFRSLRFFGGIFLFSLYFGSPWLNWDGRQAIWFDLPSRKFYILGLTFWPQDFMLLSWLLIIAAFSLFFITVYAGRVWCGYTCPQSVWTWIFMWFEEKTEGQRNRRIKLDAQSMSAEKFLRKTAKHAAWLMVAFWTGFTFVGYFSPIRTLIVDLATFAITGWSLFWILFFTVATYLNAGWMREQVCIYMCPYARFQSVMFDKDTLIVSYDPKRGETRGSRKRGVDPKELGLGDCIDCDLCVHVCPTGIDIRDGLQYECISCAACIDACDSVMDKMGYEKGLIRYTTEHNLAGEKTHPIRPRLLGYGAALIVMMSLFSYTIATRIPLAMDIIRDRGALHRMTPNGLVENSYQVKIMNMAEERRNFVLTVKGPDSLKIVNNASISLDSGESIDLPLRLVASPKALTTPSQAIFFTLTDKIDDKVKVTTESRFFGPVGFKH